MGVFVRAAPDQVIVSATFQTANAAGTRNLLQAPAAAPSVYTIQVCCSGTFCGVCHTHGETLIYSGLQITCVKPGHCDRAVIGLLHLLPLPHCPGVAVQGAASVCIDGARQLSCHHLQVPAALFRGTLDRQVRASKADKQSQQKVNDKKASIPHILTSRASPGAA